MTATSFPYLALERADDPPAIWRIKLLMREGYRPDFASLDSGNAVWLEHRDRERLWHLVVYGDGLVVCNNGRFARPGFREHRIAPQDHDAFDAFLLRIRSRDL